MSKEIIELLKAADFRLGGSRKMAEKFPDTVQVGPETDWDFYGAKTGENEYFLLSNGFRRLNCPNKNYWDNQLEDIYVLGNIEVLLRKDPDLYARAFDSISEKQYTHYLWKSSPFLVGEFDREKVCLFFNLLFMFEGR